MLLPVLLYPTSARGERMNPSIPPCFCCGSESRVNPYPSFSRSFVNFERKPLCEGCYQDPENEFSKCRHGALVKELRA